MRVTVIWLKPDQQRVLASRCPGVELRCYEPGDRLSLPSRPGDEHVVLVTRFIAHKTEQQVRAVYPKSRVHRVPGGMCRLCELINRLAAEAA